MCYIGILLFSLCNYGFILLLIRKLSCLKWLLWYSLKVMKLLSDEASHRTDNLCMYYIQLSLCVHIFHKCSQCYRVWAPGFQNHAVVQKSCGSSINISSSSSSSSSIVSLPPTPFLQGRPKNFEAFFKRVGLALFYFLGGVADPQAGDGIFQGWPEHFQLKSLNQW